MITPDQNMNADGSPPRYQVHHADVALPVDFPWHIRDHSFSPARFVAGQRYADLAEAQRVCAQKNEANTRRAFGTPSSPSYADKALRSTDSREQDDVPL
jgi:hypothetical protein